MAKVTTQIIRQYVISGIQSKLTDSKKRRIEASILRLVNEYLFERTVNNKDWDERNFKKYSKSYARFKDRYLKGKIKGRGGGRSKTVARIKARERQHNSTYAATSVDDKIRLSGLLLSALKVQDVKLVQVRGSDRFVIEYKIGIGKRKIGDNKDLDKQAQGLAQNGYKFIGFKSRSMPPDLLRSIKAAITRILND